MFSQIKKINIIYWIALLTIIVGRAFSLFPAITEKIYTQGIYKLIAMLLSHISGVFPFSLDDIFYSSLIVLFLFLMVWIILKKITFKKATFILIKSLFLIYILFYWLWGFNYYRQPLAERIHRPLNPIDSTLFYETLHQIIDQAEANYCQINTSDYSRCDSLIEASYLDLKESTGIVSPLGKRRPKIMLYSSFFAGASVFGYFGPFANEIHLNKYLLPNQYPFVLAHEKAHQMGITSEAEANFMAWIVCNNSSSKKLKYAANSYVLIHFLREIPDTLQLKNVIQSIPQPIINDLQNTRIYWNNLRIPLIDKVQSLLYNWYLKGNKVPDGIHNYQAVVTYIYNYKNIMQSTTPNQSRKPVPQ